MEFTSAEGERRLDALRAVLGESVIGLDFDGTLSPIVDDPAQAHIHPDAPAVLAELATRVRSLAVITGRPARQVLALGGLDEVADSIGPDGHELHVYGQYGNEHWSSVERRIISPRPPAGLAAFMGSLGSTLRRAEAADALVEEKGLAIAVHTRRLPDSTEAYDRLVPALGELAERHGLVLEPGRQVIEVRAPGMDKGQVVRRVVKEAEASGVCFAGDDLGDVEAFETVATMRDDGLATLLVCSLSQEESALVDRADVVVDGPAGVLDVLRALMA